MKKLEKKDGSTERFKKALFKTLPKLLEKDESFRAQFITYFAEKEKTEDRFNILLEEIRILREEGERRWQEAIRRLDEQEGRLEEHSKKLEIFTQDVHIGALGAAWSLKTERSFRNAVKGLMEEYLPVKVERYEAIDYEGEFFDGRPGIVVYTDVPIWEEEFNEGL